MKQTAFIAGQRWISTTELELGLGIIMEASGRQVRILFPACDEERIYAIQGAPLTRMMYEIGDNVADLDGNSYTVQQVTEQEGRLVYQVTDADGVDSDLPEQLLDSHAVLRRPQERLFSGQIDRSSLFDLRAATLQHLHQLHRDRSRGLLGARVQLLPHQLYIADEVSSRFAPRVLLADEVGLGKTIEAGLILHRALLSGRAARALVVVPDSLVHQWLVEMLRRFNLRFSLLDPERIAALQSEGNPFLSAQLVLCSLSTLTGSNTIAKQAQSAGWDMLVVDEAHHLGWSETASTPEYQCIEQLAEQIPGVLLLTATPEQLGQSGHYARLRLLDPQRYPSLAQYRAEEQSYQLVCDQLDHVMALQPGEPLGASLATQLDQDLCDALSCSDPQQFAAAQQTAVRSLLDRHGTGRVLFRNTRDTVSGFPERRLVEHPLPAPAAYFEEAHSLTERLQPEQVLGDSWLATDPRVSWLVEWLRQQSGKVLLICASANTARQLEEYLRLQIGTRSAVFHEGMSLVNRDRAAAYFADPDYGADILICSEIGSEGRNFQFAHQLVLFDLPLNPDLLEQRIGRLDRIGQTQVVEVHVPFYQASAQEALLRWLDQGLNAFLTPCAGGATLFAEQQAELETLLQGAPEAAQMAPFIDTTRARIDALNAQLDEGRNKLLELNSIDPPRAAALVAAVSESEQREPLQPYLEDLFDHYGIDHQQQLDSCVIVRPSEQMLADSFDGLTEDGLSGTYDRTTALHREDVEFLSWEHPLVCAAMEMVAEGEAGNSAVCTLKLPPLKPGTLLLETLFRLRVSAPKVLQLQRHLPAAAWRLVLSIDGADLSKVLPANKLTPLLGVISKDVANKLVRHARKEIAQLIAASEERAASQQASWIEQAQHSVTAELDAELARLAALAALNPNVREAELEHLRQLRQQACAALSFAQLQLDAVRVIVVN